MKSIERTFEGLMYSIEGRGSDGGVELRIGPFKQKPETLERIETELRNLAELFYSRYANTDQPNEDQINLVLPTGNRKDLEKIIATIEKRGAVARREGLSTPSIPAQLPCI